MSKFLNVSWIDIKGALVTGLIWGLLVIGSKIVDAGTIFGLDWKTIISAGAIASIAFIVSFVKSLLTTSTGKFAGVIKVK